MKLPARGPLHIVLVSSSLSGGGAERTMLTMAAAWAGDGHTITVVTLREDDAAAEYTLPAGVVRQHLRLIRERNPIWRLGQISRLLVLRRALLALRPSLVISFIDKLNVAVLLALIGTKIPVIATEHLAPWMNPLGPAWELLRRFAYRRAAAVVSPTPAITDWFTQRLAGHFVTVPYPVSIAAFVPQMARSRNTTIIAVGRLARQKGFDLLIEAFAPLAPKWPEWTLEIVGAGPERHALEEQVERLGLRSRVRLAGHVTDVADRLVQAAVYVLSSRHEAYPMALCEAMAAGCCVVATDCPTGPREIFRATGEEVGVLVPPEDSQELAAALEKVIGDVALREKLAEAARRCAPRFGPEEVMTKWEALLKTFGLVPG